MGEGDLLRVKADATGAELVIGKDAPGLLSKLFPKIAARREVDAAITERIIGKIRDGNDLEDGERKFASEFLSDAARKYLRIQAVEQRAQELIVEKQQLLLGAGDQEPTRDEEKEPEPSANETSEDWINRFREDASLVSDDMLREVYARVLAEEAFVPGAFSLRTLAVLRYLDRETALDFAKIQSVLIDGKMVPQQSRKDDVLKCAGLHHTTMLRLADAGLVNSGSTSESTAEMAEVRPFTLTGFKRFALFRREDLKPFQMKLKVHLLTPAGVQLARISDVDFDENAFDRLLRWLSQHVAGAQTYVSEMPSPNWAGKVDELSWFQWFDAESSAKEN